MSERVWHKGPPPFPGWWLAEVVGYSHRNLAEDETWGWWGGLAWSSFASKYDRPETAARCAARIGALNGSCDHIRWTDYWPENARVPRLDPTGGHWTFNADDKPPPYVGVIDVAFRRGPIEKAVPPFAWVGFDWKRGGLWSDILAWRPAA